MPDEQQQASETPSVPVSPTPSTPAVRDLSCIWGLKNKVVSMLKELNITGLGTNVYANRVSKIWPDEETLCLVNIPNVDFADNRSSPRFYIAKGDLNIDVYSRAYLTEQDNDGESETTSEISDFVDNVGKSIIEYLDLHVKAGPKGDVTRFFLKSMTNNLSEIETARGVCHIVFGFEISLVINYSSPTDEFLKAKNSIRMGAGSGNRQDFVTNVRP